MVPAVAAFRIMLLLALQSFLFLLYLNKEYAFAQWTALFDFEFVIFVINSDGGIAGIFSSHFLKSPQRIIVLLLSAHPADAITTDADHLTRAKPLDWFHG